MSSFKKSRLIIIITIFSALWAVKSTMARNASQSPLKSAVVQLKSGGRFGDNLISLAHAIYFAQKNNLELLFDPFPYSEQLVLSDVVKPYVYSMDWHFDRIIEHPGVSAEIHPELTKNGTKILFKIPYFPDAPIEYKVPNNWHPFPVDWEDQTFKQTLRKLLSPKSPLTLIKPRGDKISVAVHVRHGGSYEKFTQAQYEKNGGLLSYKIPYEEYYINQIKNLSALLANEPMYVFLFTDDNDPVGMLQRYQAKVNIPTIEFDCRKTGNSHNANVLEDFYSLMQFNCLIRSESNFSIMAEKLHDYQIVISPADLLAGETIQDGLVKVKENKRKMRFKSLFSKKAQ